MDTDGDGIDVDVAPDDDTDFEDGFDPGAESQLISFWFECCWTPQGNAMICCDLPLSLLFR